MDPHWATRGVTPGELALYIALNYRHIGIPPEDLATSALNESRQDLPISAANTEAALADCLADGRLQVVTQHARDAIVAELAAGGVLGPIYGLPGVGRVDFAPRGAAIWRAGCRRFPPFAFTDVVRRKTAHYFRSRAAALADIEAWWSEVENVTVSEPVPIGPWRAQWWRRFDEGFRVVVEERHHWEGWSEGSYGVEQCFLRRPDPRDPRRLAVSLERHGLTAAEFAVFERLEDGPQRFEPHELVSIETCARDGWLRGLDQAAIDEIRAVVRVDGATKALPALAALRSEDHGIAHDPGWPGGFRPLRWPDSRRYGEIDFTPAGAELYRAASAARLGPDWEDDLQVSRQFYREEHRYCETSEGLSGIVAEYEAAGQVVRDARIVEIGPWCVSWWERYDHGFRLELQMGDPNID